MQVLEQSQIVNKLSFLFVVKAYYSQQRIQPDKKLRSGFHFSSPPPLSSPLADFCVCCKGFHFTTSIIPRCNNIVPFIRLFSCCLAGKAAGSLVCAMTQLRGMPTFCFTHHRQKLSSLARASQSSFTLLGPEVHFISWIKDIQRKYRQGWSLIHSINNLRSLTCPQHPSI